MNLARRFITERLSDDVNRPRLGAWWLARSAYAMGVVMDHRDVRRPVGFHWQALLVYAGGAFAALEAIALLIDHVGLPEWFFTAGMVVLGLGMPVALWRRSPPSDEVRSAGPSAAGWSPPWLGRWPRVGVTLLAALAAWAILATTWSALVGRERAALRVEAVVAEVAMLAEAGQWDEAYAVALRAPGGDGASAGLSPLWHRFSRTVRIESSPAGATVWRAPYDPESTEWVVLGTTPMDGVPFPFGLSRLRFTLPGYDTLVVVAGVPAERAPIVGTGDTIGPYVLDRPDARPPGMVRVPGSQAVMAGRAVEFADFFLDRYEVTNRQFAEFVEAGGYETADFWPVTTPIRGARLGWSEAVRSFVDRTGRPGPATWEAGTYPEGRGDFPVSGVSWYEAMAYAAFAGKDLPTRHHWSQAMQVQAAAWILPRSNLEGTAPAAVGAYAGLSPFGAYDMAGNVREWTLNEIAGNRFLMGGGWSDPFFSAINGLQSDPLDRSELNGLRLAVYPDTTGLGWARQPLPALTYARFDTIPPISDEVFAVYQTQFSYDHTPLEAVVEAADTTDRWIRERVAMRPAYASDDRLLLYLYRPLASESPVQTVVYFPGGASRSLRSIDQMRTIHFDFLIASGRAVAVPVYWGILDRGRELMPRGRSAGYRDQAVRWSKDLRRSIDYLETRSDIDSERLAYYGYSFGGINLATMVVMEPRFKVAIALVGGFSRDRTLAEVDDISYVHRLTVPLLMLNGTLDPGRPIEERVRPFYDLAGTDPADKKLVLDDGGHFVPRATLVRESLDWLDRYLGVTR